MIGGMTRALFAVGALLTTAFIAFGLVVYPDPVGGPRLGRQHALGEPHAGDPGRRTRAAAAVDLRQIAPFGWDRVLVVQPGTARDAISAELGSEYTGMLPFGSTGEVFVFARGKTIARIADYRGRGTFSGFERPLTCSPAPRPSWACARW